MKVETPVLQSELSSHDIRAFTARMANPNDPLAEWRFEFAEWRKACADFRDMEQEQIIQNDAPSALTLRQHRYVLFLLLTRGEHLALVLMQDAILSEVERERLLDSVDGFLGNLRDSWHTWHGEALPEHRRNLAKFLA